MGEHIRPYNPVRLHHERPRKLITFSHAAARFALGWSNLLQMPRRQRRTRSGRCIEKR